ncbi:unnamed protein product [Rotaria socialis]|uniref:Uncharacterized protein n=2 Tax=Rotaria socialis TaxID=392032 RepID=A0A820CMJ7_9BILA|nr:unnamed protein product [Rotaria socialis]
MASSKKYFILQMIFLVQLLYMSYGRECKSCEKEDHDCLLGQNVRARTCSTENDLCYIWFDRSGSDVGVQRDCISIDTMEYDVIKDVMGEKMTGCVKRINGLDCFTFCSSDNCN